MNTHERYAHRHRRFHPPPPLHPHNQTIIPITYLSMKPQPHSPPAPHPCASTVQLGTLIGPHAVRCGDPGVLRGSPAARGGERDGASLSEGPPADALVTIPEVLHSRARVPRSPRQGARILPRGLAVGAGGPGVGRGRCRVAGRRRRRDGGNRVGQRRGSRGRCGGGRRRGRPMRLAAEDAGRVKSPRRARASCMPSLRG